jgi:hypothetical protein
LPPPDDWTVAEANAALPRLTTLLGELRASVPGVRKHHEAVSGTGRRNGHSEGRSAALAFTAAVRQLTSEGIVLRDLSRGLIDFPAKTGDDRTYWLCWLEGEPEVGWWHWPDDGFAGRRPLSEPPGTAE